VSTPKITAGQPTISKFYWTRSSEYDDDNNNNNEEIDLLKMKERLHIKALFASTDMWRCISSWKTTVGNYRSQKETTLCKGSKIYFCGLDESVNNHNFKEEQQYDDEPRWWWEEVVTLIAAALSVIWLVFKWSSVIIIWGVFEEGQVVVDVTPVLLHTTTTTNAVRVRIQCELSE